MISSAVVFPLWKQIYTEVNNSKANVCCSQVIEHGGESAVTALISCLSRQVGLRIQPCRHCRHRVLLHAQVSHSGFVYTHTHLFVLDVIDGGGNHPAVYTHPPSCNIVIVFKPQLDLFSFGSASYRNICDNLKREIKEFWIKHYISGKQTKSVCWGNIMICVHSFHVVVTGKTFSSFFFACCK